DRAGCPGGGGGRHAKVPREGARHLRSPSIAQRFRTSARMTASTWTSSPVVRGTLGPPSFGVTTTPPSTRSSRQGSQLGGGPSLAMKQDSPAGQVGPADGPSP